MQQRRRRRPRVEWNSFVSFRFCTGTETETGAENRKRDFLTSADRAWAKIFAWKKVAKKLKILKLQFLLIVMSGDRLQLVLLEFLVEAKISDVSETLPVETFSEFLVEKIETIFGSKFRKICATKNLKVKICRFRSTQTNFFKTHRSKKAFNWSKDNWHFKAFWLIVKSQAIC